MAQLTISPTNPTPGSSIKVSGTGFLASKGYAIALSGRTVATGVTSAAGALSATVTIPAGASGSLTMTATVKQTTSASIVVVQPPPPIVYTFRDDFSGGLDRAVWQTTKHVPSSIVKVFDQVAVVNGMLELGVQRMPDGTFHGGLVDTLSFTQLYGRFGVRCKVSQVKGGFAAPLWAYAKGVDMVNGVAVPWENELDVCEILANPPGTNPKGYSPYPFGDVTLAHFHCIKNASRPGWRYHLPTPAGFADGLHAFEMDWRKDHVSWLVDGVERARVTDPALIPDHAMPLILNNAIGGSWAGAPDATTPDRSVLWIDEVWATA